MVQGQEQPVNFFDHLERFRGLIRGRQLVVFLDYDGTLTPIVDTPDLAVMSPPVRETVRNLSARVRTAIVSGRATDDVRSKVQIPGIFYAGSHGFEIVDPEGKVTVNEQAQRARAVIDRVHGELSRTLSPVKGALVEHVKYTISTHYRLVSDADFPKVEKAVQDVLAANPELRVTSGKKVFELRPRIDWDKGKAVSWILNILFPDGQCFPLYVGDDTTDEDAFRVVKGKGAGILVADPVRPSEAEYVIRDTSEVKELLETLIEIMP